MNMNRSRWRQANPERVYIAAPLFNEPQLHTIECIEGILTQGGHDWFSPRWLHPDGKSTKITSKAQADEVYHKNLEGLRWCSTLLAVLDYELTPPGTALYALKGDPLRTGGMGLSAFELVGGPLTIPDTGVSFELGYVKGMHKGTVRVIGFVRQAGPVNLMIGRTCDAVLPGLARLLAWASTIDIETRDAVERDYQVEDLL